MTTAHRSIDEGFSSVTAPDEPWVDTKRRWWLLGLIVPTLPVLAWAAGTFSGISLGWWLGPFLVVVVIPGVDALLGEDRSNPPLIIVHGTMLNHVPETYRRYLENTFREVFKLKGKPLRVDFKVGHNPYADKKPAPLTEAEARREHGDADVIGRNMGKLTA